jgi:hypothetical protein
MAREPRYHAISYVCDTGRIVEPVATGLVTLSQLFVGRPPDCRWAVVRAVPPQVLAIDLYDVRIYPRGRLTLGPTTAVPFPDVDSAVMACCIGYNTQLTRGP